jgi:hypothetical protein
MALHLAVDDDGLTAIYGAKIGWLMGYNGDWILTRFRYGVYVG